MTINDAAREAARLGDGKFGTQEHARPQRGLDHNWGNANLREGSRTPWGSAQHVADIAPGIAQVSTAGHGGVFLTKERNAEVPPSLRQRSGWYEEDCEASIPTMIFAEEFCAERQTWTHLPADQVDPYADPEFMRADSARIIKDYFPDQWEATYGPLAPGESRARDEHNWAKANEIHFVTTSAIRDENNPGMVRVTARQEATGETRTFAVPAEDYSARHENNEPGQNNRFVIDLKKHLWLGN